jgi:hypothetical protein
MLFADHHPRQGGEDRREGLAVNSPHPSLLSITTDDDASERIV